MLNAGGRTRNGRNSCLPPGIGLAPSIRGPGLQTPAPSRLVPFLELCRSTDNRLDHGRGIGFASRPFLPRCRPEPQRQAKEGSAQPPPVAPQPEGGLVDRKGAVPCTSCSGRGPSSMRQADDARILDEMDPLHVQRRAIDEAAVYRVDRQAPRDARTPSGAGRSDDSGCHGSEVPRPPPASRCATGFAAGCRQWRSCRPGNVPKHDPSCSLPG